MDRIPTEELTESALSHNFAAVDTANYPTAYDKGLAGEGIAAALPVVGSVKTLL